MNKFLLTLLLFFITFIVFSSDLTAVDETNDRKKIYNSEKLSFSSKKYFDLLYPEYVKKFDFFKGGNKITYQEFETTTKDPVLFKNKEIIKQIKLGGFTGAVVLGVSSVSFLIPSIIFVALQTNFYNQKQNLTGYESWLDYFMVAYPSYFIPGMICISLTIITALSILVDLTITFALLHKYQNNEKLYRDAIERYNKQLREKYRIMPDISIGSKNEIILGIISRI